MKKSISSRLERSVLLSNGLGTTAPAQVSPLKTSLYLERSVLLFNGSTNSGVQAPPFQMPVHWHGRSLDAVTSTCTTDEKKARTRISIMAPDKPRRQDNGTPPSEDEVAETMSYMMSRTVSLPTPVSPVSPRSFDCGRSHSSSIGTSTGLTSAIQACSVHQEEETCKTPSTGFSTEHEQVTFLPSNYQPTEYDVLCGRGFKRWKGNERYRAVVYSKLDVYAAAKCKSEKSGILVTIVALVRQKSGSFLRKCPETDRWYDVGDFMAKEKTSQYFRDALHDQYRSSGPSKYKRRKIEAMKEGMSVRQVVLANGDESQSGRSAGSNNSGRQSGSTMQSRSNGNHPPSQKIPQQVSTTSPSEAAVVTALQTMAFSAAPSPEVVVCALQLAMRQPNESLFEASMRVLDGTTNVAYQHKVDLFVLPELSPVGYSEDTFANLLPTTPKLIETYRQIDQAFANQARILQSYICYGTIGRNVKPDGSVGFTIRQIVLDRNGLQVASYDKIHLCDFGKCAETRFFEPGPRKPVSFSIDGFRFGLLICADMRNPTLSRSLARDHNVDVLLQPAAFARDVSFRTWKSFRETRAVENSVYFIGVNYAGEGFGETSVVPPWVDESHEPLVLGTAEGFLLGRIQRSELNSVRTSMPFYRQLCAERISK